MFILILAFLLRSAGSQSYYIKIVNGRGKERKGQARQGKEWTSGKSFSWQLKSQLQWHSHTILPLSLSVSVCVFLVLAASAVQISFCVTSGNSAQRLRSIRGRRRHTGATKAAELPTKNSSKCGNYFCKFASFVSHFCGSFSMIYAKANAAYL